MDMDVSAQHSDSDASSLSDQIMQKDLPGRISSNNCSEARGQTLDCAEERNDTDNLDSDGDSDIFVRKCKSIQKRRNMIGSDDSESDSEKQSVKSHAQATREQTPESPKKDKLIQGNKARLRKSNWSDTESENEDAKESDNGKISSNSSTESEPEGNQTALKGLVDSDDEPENVQNTIDHSAAADGSSDSEDCLPSIPHFEYPKQDLPSAANGNSDSDDCLPSIPDFDYPTEKTATKSKTQKSATKEKPKKVSAKKREKELKETLSKTQKLIREQPVALPYEKPKELSLTEFLAKRKQAKAEFYNPKLKDLRPPTTPALDLSTLEQELPSKKVEAWACDSAGQLKSGESAVDDAFNKLDLLLMIDFDLDNIEPDGNHEPVSDMDIAVDGLKCNEMVDENEENSVQSNNVAETEQNKCTVQMEETDIQPNKCKSFLATNESSANSASPKAKENEICSRLCSEKGFEANDASQSECQEIVKPKPPRISLRELLANDPAYADVVNIKPTFQTGLGFINFSEPRRRSQRRDKVDQGVDTLKNRFIKHATTAKKPTEQHFVVTVTTKEEDSQGNQKSTVSNVDYIQNVSEVEGDANTAASTATKTPPGLKFSQLKEKIQAKIRAAKVKDYEEKMKNCPRNNMENTEKEELEEAEEFLENTEYSTESEPEVTDEETEALREAIRKKKKRKVKSAFVDEEAEVSGSELSEEDDDADNENSDADVSEGECEDELTKTENEKSQKQFRRVKTVVDSSDEDEELPREIKAAPTDESAMIAPPLPSGLTNETEAVDSQKLSVVDDIGDSEQLQSTQPFSSQMDLFHMNSQESPLITPAQRDFSKLMDEPIMNSPRIPPPSIPHLDDFASSEQWDSEVKKPKYPPVTKLTRFDSEAALDSFRQDMPCTPPMITLPMEIAKLVGNSLPENTSQDLTAICSGIFPTQTPLTPAESQCPAFNSQTPTCNKTQAFEAESSEIVTTTPKIERDTLKKTRLQFEQQNNVELPTDSEQEEDELPVTRKVKKNRRLQFSDDEDEEIEAQESVDDEIDAQKDVTNDIERGYDSEENEIPISKPKDKKGIVSKLGKIRREFVENEAELSGSEDGSADEDERGLDQMDDEDGDEEQFDEEALRHQLGQQHVKNLIDDDDRQIRILQNALLEDGDLHGEGELRAKQFKWKQIDNFNMDVISGDGIGECGAVAFEDEAERNWQEEKAEKARWLKVNSQAAQDSTQVDFEEDSQKLFLEKSKYFKLGRSALKKIERSCSFLDSQSQLSTSISFSESMTLELSAESLTSRRTSAIFASPDDPILKIKRGSFLARGTSELSKIAEMTKGGESNNSAKANSRNFVFSVITPPEPETKGKRKNLPRHPSSRTELQGRKMPRMDRSFDSLDAATKASSIFSQY